MNERIKELRKALDLTQQEFADKIGMKRNTIASYEINRNGPSNSVISLICKAFNVSETWLRTGEGEMFVKQTEDDELAQVLSAIAASDDELIKRIIRAYWKLDDKEKAAVKKLIDSFTTDNFGPAVPVVAPLPSVAEKQQTDADAAGQSRTEPDLAAKVAELERQNQELAAKVAAMEEEDALLGLTDRSSASPSASAGNHSPAEKVKK